MSKIKVKGERLKVKGILIFLSIFQFSISSCTLEEAKWNTEDVSLTMQVSAVSAGFIECRFTTSKDAYYLIDCVPVDKEVQPYAHQKQFMTLAIDSAYIDYLQWRYWLLEAGESYIAPFASHSLQYGDVDKIFTNLTPGSDYWVYAFVVNPETNKPAGRLYLQTVHTADSSLFDVHFDYRVRDVYDYIYPTTRTDPSIITSPTWPLRGIAPGWRTKFRKHPKTISRISSSPTPSLTSKRWCAMGCM